MIDPVGWLLTTLDLLAEDAAERKVQADDPMRRQYIKGRADAYRFAAEEFRRHLQGDGSDDLHETQARQKDPLRADGSRGAGPPAADA